MKLNNFKELLSKKADNNPNLQLLIKYMRDDYLIDHVVESLEKMAAIYSKKNPNHAVMHFGTHMDADTEGDMIHDALSHHASHYKAALKAGNEKLADSHMKKIFEIKHMSEKMTRDGLHDHSSGKLNIEAVDPKPWERSGYANEKSPGKFSTDTKGWARHGSNYSWLRGAPHGSYEKETKVHGHDQAYPIEEMKVNGKYIHIDDDIDNGGKHVNHPFDSHPIMSHFKGSPTAHTSDKHAEYLKAADAFNDEGGGADAYFDSIESRDPEAHAARGSKKADAIHAPLLDKDDAMARLAEITGNKPKQEAATPKVTTTPKAPAPASDKDDAMAKLKQIMGKDFKG